MPFSSEEIVERFREALASGRLSHAYLLQGSDRHELKALGEKLAEIALKAPVARHPDFHLVQPESKSRRIKIEHIRELEKALHLKAYSGGVKVALLCEVERMCLGGAEAANAFLKTLEEPEPGTLLLLTSAEPALVLPTILSRCVRLGLVSGPAAAATEEEADFLDRWFSVPKKGPLRAYARAALFGQRCQQLREAIQEAAEEASGADDEEAEETLKAAIEGEYLLARRRLIASIEQAVWGRADASAPDPETLRVVSALEDLDGSLFQNVEQNLAVERAALAIEGLVSR